MTTNLNCSIPRRLKSVSNQRRVAVVLFCCIVTIAYALVGNGYTVWSWGTTTDKYGIDIGPVSDRTCFLSGVSGNLNSGSQMNFGCGNNGVESIAETETLYPPAPKPHYRLVGHGGACQNQLNVQTWNNNPVNAQATCFWTVTNVASGEWQAGNKPTKIAGLISGKRQCFLAGLWGVSGSWNDSSRFARVRKITTPDSAHPTTGWYVEGNMPVPADGSHARVYGRCVDFPANTILVPGVAPASDTTKTYVLTTGTGVKACALTGVGGAFKENSWTDGVLMSWPTAIDGNWSLTITTGKSATWVCAR